MNKVFKGRQVRQVHAVRPVFRVSQEVLVRQERRDLPEGLVYRALPASRVSQAYKVRKARPAKRALRDHKESQAHKVIRVVLGFKEILAVLEPPAYRDLLEVLERLVHKVSPDRLELMAYRALRGLLVLRGVQGLPDPKDLPAYRDLKALLAVME